MNKYDEAIRNLANGFSEMFAETVAADERFHDLLMELADEFVSQEIPVVSEDSQTDLAAELMMRVTTRKV
jgi:hypothetical protein